MKEPVRYPVKADTRAAAVQFCNTFLSRAGALILGFVASTSIGMAAQPQTALPDGGQVTAGSATVSQTANELVVSQASDRLSMNWQSFDIGAGNSVRFDQPSANSIALNRVLGGNRSEIYGNLSANGQVFLINPNGVLFGASAQVDVGGLVASTLNLTDRDFLDGNFSFSDPANRAGVVNEGTLTARNGGYLALIGNRVNNSGAMQAHLGSVVLGAGGTAQLTLADSSLVKFEVTQSALNALAENGGLIRADGGRVLLTAGARDSLLASMVNNTGVIEARTVERQSGNILLLAGMEAGTTHVGGTLDASAPVSLNSTGGDGGFIETSGAHVKVAHDAHITTLAAGGKTGKWLIDPQDFTIGTGGDITGTDLSSALVSNNVEIQSSSGGALGNGDINVNDDVNWDANTLTLTAARDINLNAWLIANGSSILVMNTGAANGADAGVAGGTVKATVDAVNMGFAGRVEFDRSGSGFLTINGEDYTVIRDVDELQAMSGNLAGRYALGTDIAASATALWNGNAGFVPVGSDTSAFTGIFDGLGHTISGLTINRPSQGSQGLFGRAQGATLRNVGLAGGTIAGASNVGTLLGVGTSGITLHNALSSATVSGATAGGVVGTLATSNMSDVHATGDVSNPGSNGDERGGLIGISEQNMLTRVSASGNLNGDGLDLGGLIGISLSDVITDASASGNVTPGGTRHGGLIGFASGTSIVDSHATGNVGASGASVTDTLRGGLVGETVGGSITNSYATGAVQGSSDIGGLVGRNGNSGTLENVYATGNVISNGGDRVGGLVGDNTGALTNVRAEGSVSGNSLVGGLAGNNTAAINGASAGTVSGSGVRSTVSGTGDYVGGLVGYNDGGAISGTSVTSVLAQSDVTGAKSWLGGAIGYNHHANLSYVSATGAVSGTGSVSPDGQFVGGLVGEHAGGTINHGNASGAVQGRTRVGGLIGRISADTSVSGALQNNLLNSSASGNVTRAGTATAGFVGGLVGEVNVVQLIQDVLATGDVNGGGASLVGGLLGRLGDGTLDNGVARGHVTGGHTIGGLVGENINLIFNSHAEGTVTATNPGGNGAQAGGLVGRNTGGITGSYATGDVSSTGGSRVGGLVGYNNSELTNVYATGSATGTSDVGGLIGYHDLLGLLSDSYATGSVTATVSNAGGLIGLNSGTVTDVYATGNVTGVSVTGGLIGATSASVSNVYATGNVTGVGTTGGLIGDVVGLVTVSDSYATGAVSGSGGVGGLIGRVNNGVLVTRVYANGTVSGETVVGGLVGINDGTIRDAYATGAISASGTNPRVGGVVGRNDDNGIVQRVYAAGPIDNGASTLADNTTGGLIGDNVAGGALIDSYWDASLRLDQRFDIGGTTSTGGRLGDILAKTQSSYAGFDFTNTWVIYEGFTRPLLRSFLTPLTVTANNAAKTYDGANFSGGNGVTYSATPTADLLGTLGYSGTSQGARNAGTYNIRAAGMYSHQQGYLINLVDGALTVAQAPLTLSTTSVTKTYDGTAAANGTAIVTGGALITGDTLGSGSFEFLDKKAGTGKAVRVNSVTVNDGNGGANYNISYADNTTSTINRATLSASGITADNKVYDGTTVASLDTSAGSLSGVIGGDDVALPMSGMTANFADKNVGAGKTVNLSGATLSGADAGNYMLTSLMPVTADITPAALTISGITANNKVYDGTVAATVNTGGALYTGLIGGDEIAVNTTGTFSDKNVGAAKTVTLSSSYSGADAGNYLITGQATTSADITPRQATVTANDISKTYGDTYNFTGNEFTATGLVAGETIGVSLASAGSAANATVAGGPYAITISGAGGGSFDPANYILSYVEGSLTVNRAPLTITANGDSRVYDGSAYSGGNGVVYAGFVNGETSAVLGGSLSYGGSAQGAVNAGAYTIAPGGLTADNYAISYADGVLIITEIAEMQAATTAAKQIDMTFGGFDEAGHQPINFAIVGAGIRLPQEEE